MLKNKGLRLKLNPGRLYFKAALAVLVFLPAGACAPRRHPDLLVTMPAMF